MTPAAGDYIIVEDRYHSEVRWLEVVEHITKGRTLVRWQGDASLSIARTDLLLINGDILVRNPSEFERLLYEIY